MTLNKPHTPVEIVHLLFSSCPPDDPQAAVMQQELIIACADLVRERVHSLYESLLFSSDLPIPFNLQWCSDYSSLLVARGHQTSSPIRQIIGYRWIVSQLSAHSTDNRNTIQSVITSHTIDWSIPLPFSVLPLPSLYLPLFLSLFQLIIIRWLRSLQVWKVRDCVGRR